MTEPARAAVVPRLEKSNEAIVLQDWSILSNESFPASHRLIVTTARGVYEWTSKGVTEIFHSGSGGIVAAKRMTGRRNLFAIADSQVVILHSPTKGVQESYRLKGAKGRVRFLHYEKDSDCLFFTTNLQHAVQSYSLHQKRLLAPAHIHPSPPTVFATSPSSQYIISASNAPVAIYLNDVGMPGPAIHLVPCCSTSAVAAAAFSRDGLDKFALAFADGTLAVFSASKGREIAHIQRLHVVSTQAVSPDDEITPSFDGFDGFDSGTGNISIDHRRGRFMSISFVPGFPCRTVSIGADGNCCIVDFTVNRRAIGVVMKTWHVHTSTTSLSIALCPEKPPSHAAEALQHDTLHPASQFAGAETLSHLIAIGCQDGTVIVYGLKGALKIRSDYIARRTFDTASPIFDVELVEEPAVEGTNECTPTISRMQDSEDVSDALSKPKTLSKALTRTHSQPNITLGELGEIRTVDGVSKLPLSIAPTKVYHTEQNYQGSLRVVSKNKSTAFGPEVSVVNPHPEVSTPNSRESQNSDDTITTSELDTTFTIQKRRKSNVYTLVEKPRKTSSVSLERAAPRVPPRPIPRKGGKLAARRAETARLSRNARDDAPNSPSRRKTNGTAAVTKVFTSPALVRVAHNQGVQQINAALESDPPTSGNDRSKPAHFRSRPVEEAVKTRNPSKEPQNHPRVSNQSSPIGSNNPIITVFQPSTTTPTEASNDTIIDWKPAAVHPKPKLIYKRPPKPLKKSAVTDIPPLTPLSGSRSSASEDTIIDWAPLPSLPRSPARLNLHQDMVFTAGRYEPEARPCHASATTKPQRSISPLELASLSSAFHPPTTPEDQRLRAPAAGTDDQTTNAAAAAVLAYVEGQRRLDVPQLQAVVRDELAALRDQLAAQFLAQRRWLENLLREQDDWRRALEEENRLLREEMGRERKYGKMVRGLAGGGGR